jgi:hypothetical protein
VSVAVDTRSQAAGTALKKAADSARRLRMVGDSVDHVRRLDDFYSTPPEAVHALLAVENFQGDILEPACGDGAISKVLEAAGHTVRSTDLVERGYGEAGHDFLMFGYPYRAANIVTNPPFKLAEQFVDRALEHADDKVVMLLKLNFLEGGKRAPWLKRTPLKKVWIFAKRLTFRIPGRETQGNGMIAFAWLIWEHGHTGDPTIGWLT